MDMFCGMDKCGSGKSRKGHASMDTLDSLDTLHDFLHDHRYSYIAETFDRYPVNSLTRTASLPGHGNTMSLPRTAASTLSGHFPHYEKLGSLEKGSRKEAANPSGSENIDSRDMNTYSSINLKQRPYTWVQEQQTGSPLLQRHCSGSPLLTRHHSASGSPLLPGYQGSPLSKRRQPGSPKSSRSPGLPKKTRSPYLPHKTLRPPPKTSLPPKTRMMITRKRGSKYVSHTLEMCLAKALYDNAAESVDELEFRRGDVLMVIEQNTSGLDGWWLCSFKGKQGIAPGNRLQIISGTATPQQPAQQPAQPQQQDPNETNWKRRSWHLNPDKVVTPHKMGSVYIYDQPNRDYQDYDVPPSRYFPTYDGFSNGQINPSYPQHKDLYDSPQACMECNMSNRSSSVSGFSIGSGVSSSMSNHSLLVGSEPPSSCGSTRSSTDLAGHDLYDIPPQPKPLMKNLQSPGSFDNELYDVPPSHRNKAAMEIYDTPPSKKNIMQDIYDIPPCKGFPTDIYDTPPSKAQAPQMKSLMRERLDGNRDGRSSSGDSGIVSAKLDSLYDIPQATLDQIMDEIYDVPPSNAEVIGVQGRVKGLQAHGNLDPTSVYDIPPQVTRDSAISVSETSEDDKAAHRLSTCSTGSDAPLVIYDELPLDLDSAMELLVKLQQDVQSSTSKLLSYVSSSWRHRENLEPVVYNIKTACHTFKNSIKEFFDFGSGALANSAKVEDKKLIKKLSKELEPIQIASESICNSVQGLDHIGWHVQQLVEGKDREDDDLNIIIHHAKEVTSSVRSLASLIQGNITLLFKRSQTEVDPVYTQVKSPGPPVKPKPATVERKTSIQDRPLPPPPPNLQNAKKSFNETPKEKELQMPVIEDYDYVSLDKKMAQNKNDTENSGMSQRFQERLNQFQQNSQGQKRVNTLKLHDNDKQLLVFYANQIDLYSVTVVSAMDDFFRSIENNQPPKYFIGQCKLMILAAHKLVYMGDTLHRNVLNEDVRNKVMTCANVLCDSLKLTVMATKNAALQYPSVTCMQEMVDRVVDVSHAANELKLVVSQAATL